MGNFTYKTEKLGRPLLLGEFALLVWRLTAYDNYRFSKDHSVMVDFVIRYIGGSLIVLDIHSKNGFWELLKFDPHIFS